MTVPVTSLLSASLFLVSSAILAFRQRHIKQQWLRRLIDFFEVFAILGAVSLSGCIASYEIAASTEGYHDVLPARIDTSVGLDWRVAYSATMHSPMLQFIGRNAYSMVIQLPFLLLTILCAAGRGDLARRYLVAFSISLILTMLFFALAPAAGPINFFPMSQGTYLPQTGHLQVEMIDLLRARGMEQIEFAKLTGIVSYPSFHAAAGVLLLWIASWFGPFRWPIYVAALLMLAATPVEGNHYFVDLLGGAINAVIAIWLSGRCGRIRLNLRAILWRAPSPSHLQTILRPTPVAALL